MIRLALLTVLPLFAGACAVAQSALSEPPVRSWRATMTGTRIRGDRVDARANAVTMAAAGQVRRCYRSPRIPSVGRQIVTHLRVRYSVDGMLEEAPAFLSQDGVTAENQAYALPMAQAASMAVLRCTPLRLPARLHRGGWDHFDLTFSPNTLV